MEICELAGVDGDGYDLRTVFTTDVEHDGEESTPLFRAAAQYRPARRLARKLELEGLLWIS